MAIETSFPFWLTTKSSPDVLLSFVPLAPNKMQPQSFPGTCTSSPLGLVLQAWLGPSLIRPFATTSSPDADVSSVLFAPAVTQPPLTPPSPLRSTLTELSIEPELFQSSEAFPAPPRCAPV